MKCTAAIIFFIDDARYQEMVNGGELLEHARVFDYHYGTPAAFVREHIGRGTDVLSDIDWQGTRQLTEKPGRPRQYFIPSCRRCRSWSAA